MRSFSRYRDLHLVQELHILPASFRNFSVQPSAFEKNDLIDRLSGATRRGASLFALLLIYMLVKSLYFALNIGPNISPDEITMYGRSLIFSEQFLLPVDSPRTYEHGLITHIPFLYFWLGTWVSSRPTER